MRIIEFFEAKDKKLSANRLVSIVTVFVALFIAIFIVVQTKNFTSELNVLIGVLLGAGFTGKVIGGKFENNKIE